MSAGARPDPVRELLVRAVAEGLTPGAAWHVSGPRGVLSHGAVGLACREPVVEPASPATPYDLASLTKVLATAPLLAQLEEQGGLRLDEPVAGRLEELRGSDWGSRTLLDYAVHVAGLPAWHPCYLGPPGRSGYLRTIAELTPAGPCGAVLYSDLGYIVLGAVLERAFGESLERLFERRIAGPLGLARTGFATRPERYPDAAATERGNAFERRLAGAAGARHAWREHVLRGEVHDGNAHGLGGAAGHAGLFGPASEVAAIGRALAAPSALVLGPAARERLLRPIAGVEGRSVGFVAASASRAARGALPDDAPGHTGFTGTSIWIEPQRQRVYVLLSNRVHPAVQDRDFQPLRLEFHRVAASLEG